MDGGAWWATVHWVAKSGTQMSDFTFTLLPVSSLFATTVFIVDKLKFLFETSSF